jgi:hypothetical protein
MREACTCRRLVYHSPWIRGPEKKEDDAGESMSEEIESEGDGEKGRMRMGGVEREGTQERI